MKKKIILLTTAVLLVDATLRLADLGGLKDVLCVLLAAFANDEPDSRYEY